LPALSKIQSAGEKLLADVQGSDDDCFKNGRLQTLFKYSHQKNEDFITKIQALLKDMTDLKRKLEDTKVMLQPLFNTNLLQSKLKRRQKENRRKAKKRKEERKTLKDAANILESSSSASDDSNTD
jgi:hypothetical protein